MREIKKIIIHCSDSPFGDAALIDQWHRDRGWDGIGYHYVIMNGYVKKGIYDKCNDGVIEPGRHISKVGAHCFGQNKRSIGICLIGKYKFSANQLLESLPALVASLCKEYGLTANDVYAHSEFNTGKTCPNIDAVLLRTALGRLV
jgi:hypothetical protein